MKKLLLILLLGLWASPLMSKDPKWYPSPEGLNGLRYFDNEYTRQKDGVYASSATFVNNNFYNTYTTTNTINNTYTTNVTTNTYYNVYNSTYAITYVSGLWEMTIDGRMSPLDTVIGVIDSLWEIVGGRIVPRDNPSTLAPWYYDTNGDYQPQ